MNQPIFTHRETPPMHTNTGNEFSSAPVESYFVPATARSSVSRMKRV